MASDNALQLAAPNSSSVRGTFLWLALLLALTLLAAGAGTALGFCIIAMIKENAQAKKHAQTAPAESLNYSIDTNLRSLPPIVCNFASPDKSWIRLEAAFIFDKRNIQNPEILAAEISQDILGYLKTLTLSDVSGPSGLQHLREDLNERVAIRSAGKVRELIIQSLIVQ